MPRLVIRALGPLEFVLDGQPLAGIEYNKVRALLLTLALTPDRAQSRASLCAMLWPDLPEKSARNNLSQALTNLRKVFPSADEPFITATNVALRINSECPIQVEVDAPKFEALIDACERHTHAAWHTCAQCVERLDGAADLYRGDFLSEFSLPDSAPFEEWAQGFRQRLHQRALSVLDRLMRAAEWRNQLAQAIALARRQVALDPLNEASQRELIRLLARNQQLAAARDQCDTLRNTLAAELGIEPEPATLALLARLTPEPAAKLPALQAPVSRLPVPAMPLIGRDDELRDLTALMRDDGARLLTITGPAGVGKTRLGLALADALRFDYADGALLLELAPLSTADEVVPALAQALNLTDESADAVLDHLRRKHMLLVLDNMEHVLDAAEFVAAMLTHAPALAIVATSRSALRIRSERQFGLEPLTQPAAEHFFLDRARATRFDFEPAGADHAAIGAICRRLDGLPLAIELVAARVDVATPEVLLGQIAPYLPSLSDGPRDLPERHRTMHAAIDWSARLLNAAQRDAFARLSVFAGGFDRAAAAAVCAASADALNALARGSLIQFAGGDRWRMIEPVRQFAEALLVEHDAQAEAKARHAEYYAALAGSADAYLLGPEATAWMTRLDNDHANIQAASRWALQNRRPEPVFRIGLGIFRFWFRRGFWREGLGWLEQALALDADAANQRATAAIDARDALRQRAEALRVAGFMAQLLSLFERAEGLFAESLALARELGANTLAASVYHNLGALREAQGCFDEALAYFDQSLEHRPDRTRKYPWQSAADTLFRLGRYDESRLLYERAMALNRQYGDEEGLALTLRGLAAIACRTGDVERAERLARESETICRKIDHARGLSLCAELFGDIARARGDLRLARERYLDALAQMDGMGDARGRCGVLVALGHLSVAEGDCAQALTRLAEARAGWQALGAKLTPHEEARIAAGFERCPE